MKRKTILALTAATVISMAVLPCYAASNDSGQKSQTVVTTASETTDVWTIYQDNSTGEIFVGSQQYFSGVVTANSGETSPIYCVMAVDRQGVFLKVTEDGQGPIFFEQSFDDLPVYIYQSSGLQRQVKGSVTAGDDKIRVDSEGSADIIQDMRMITGETIIAVGKPTAGVASYQFSIPHDSDFQKFYDSVKES